MTLDEAPCSGRKCRNAPDQEIGEAGKDRRTGGIRLQFVLPFPDTRRQKAEVQRSVSRPDNVRRGAVAEPRHRPRLGYTRAIQGMVAIGTRNQQWLANARGYYFSRTDRSLHQRRDREGRTCAHHQGTRSKSYQQTHLSQVGHLPATGGQTISGSGLAPKIAIGPKNQRPYSKSHAPPLRESHH